VNRLLTVIFIFTNLALSAQDSLRLSILTLDKDDIFIKKNIIYKEDNHNPATLSQTLNQTLFQLHDKGYLAASIDSLIVVDSTRVAYLYVGEQYEWASLKNGNVQTIFLDKIGFKERLYSGKVFHYRELRNLQEKLLTYAENNGFPFARVWLDSLQINGNQIAAQLYFKKGGIVRGGASQKNQ